MTVKPAHIAAVKAIKSPVRTQIMEILLSGEPLSVAAMAARLGKRPVALYHHVKVLTAAGMIKPSGMAGRGREAEQLYAAVARGFKVKTKGLSGAERGELAELGAAHVRYALRRYARGLVSGSAELSGPGRTALVRHMMLRLTPRQLKDLNDEIDNLVSKWASLPAQAGECAVSLALLMGPAEN